jgi:2-methylcitrate dehydratase PrpD
VVYQPESMMAAQYSMPFTAALALYRDLADPDCYEGNTVSDPAVLATARKVHAHLDPEIDRYPRYAARIKAQFKDGRTITVDAWDHRGTEQKPFSNEDVVAKFGMMTASVLPASAGQRIIEATAALDSDGSDGVEKLRR